MLPYTALHHLLLNQTDPVLKSVPVPPLLVMTSGNFREEPIAITDEEALQRLTPLADAFLLHNRDIHMRCDDSVVRVDHHRSSDNNGHHSSTIYLRRSRGYVPQPVKLPFEIKPTLAVGGEIKNVFCVARGHHAFLSHHIGDLVNVETCEAFEQGVEHFSRILNIQPEIIAHDLNPNYFTTQHTKRSNVQKVGVQHHHAHIASCMLDNGLDDRRLIGLSFDGGGYGIDGAIWGGDAILASFADFDRFARLEYLPLPNVNLVTPSPWRIAVGYAHALDIDISDLPFLQEVDQESLHLFRQQISVTTKTQLTSSVGRLLDAVASLVGVCDEVTYEGQAAMELETLSRPFIPSVSPYPYHFEEKSPSGNDARLVVCIQEILSSVVQDVLSNVPAGIVGARFHKTIAEIALEMSRQARSQTKLNEVALSGGSWQNQILLNLVRNGLEQEGFVVYSHQQVPTNDGGLALGQTAIANRSQGIQELTSAIMDGKTSAKRV
jgi:hydrogenase maturation protein HypF